MGIARHSVTRQRQAREQGEKALRARDVRRRVAAQVAGEIVARDMTGSKDHVALCLRRVVEAEGTGDPNVLRGALADLILGTAAYVAAIDLRSKVPHYTPARKSKDQSRADALAEEVLDALRRADPEAPPPEWVESNGSSPSNRRRRNGREHI